MRSLFKFLVEVGCLSKNPVESIEKPKAKKTLIQTFGLAEVEALLATCGRDFTGVRDRAMLTVLFDCGLRVSELCGLCLQDVDWTERLFLVTGKGTRQRTVPFGLTTRKALQGYIARRGDLETSVLFVTINGNSLDRFRVQKIIQARGAKAGIEGVRCSPHTFRYTFAVSDLRNGGDVFSLQKIPGPATLDMTRRYAEFSQADVQEKRCRTD